MNSGESTKSAVGIDNYVKVGVKKPVATGTPVSPNLKVGVDARRNKVMATE